MNRTREVSLLAALLMLVGPGNNQASAQTDKRIAQITNAAALPLERTVLEVRLSEIQSFAGGDFRFDYDPTVLLIEDVRLSLSTSSFIIAHDLPEPGVLAVSLASAEGLESSGAGVVFTVEVAVGPSVSLSTVTAIVFHSARWYDEESVRYGLVADNAVLFVGDSVPSEEMLGLLIGENSASPGTFVEIPLSVSMGAGVGEVSGEIHYDSLSLLLNGFVPSVRLLGWEDWVESGADSFVFQLRGDRELEGTSSIDLGSIQFMVSPNAPVGSMVPVDLLYGEARSLDGCPFLTGLVAGHVRISEPPATVENWFLQD